MFVDNVRRIYEALDWRLIFLEAPPQNAQKYGSDMNAVYRLWDSQEVAWFKEEQDGVQMIIHWPPSNATATDPAPTPISSAPDPDMVALDRILRAATDFFSNISSQLPNSYEIQQTIEEVLVFISVLCAIYGYEDITTCGLVAVFKNSFAVNRHHIDDLHLNDITFGRVQTAAHVKQQQNNDWAHVVNVNKGIANFSEVVPQPAREFPFELETFEKEAVCHLDQLD
ncbi:hypothetical protein LXG23DRAFT_33542 [Yarrowia lipolytica]|nr:hypothetical protein LXG23DRAFT_33542 [Yarrowia lipolytica]